MSITTITYDYDYPGNFLTTDWKFEPQLRVPVTNPGTSNLDLIPSSVTTGNVGAIRVDNLTLVTGATAVQNYRLSIRDNSSSVLYYLQHNLEIPPYTQMTLIDKSSPVWLNSADMRLQHFCVGSVTIQVTYTIHKVPT